MGARDISILWPDILGVGALRQLGASADRAGHAGTAKPAIAERIFGQILLVVILGEVELARIKDLGGDRAVALGLDRLLIQRLRRLGGLALFGREGVDAGTVLSADVVALAHALRRVVALPERLEQRLVGNLFRVVDHQHHLIVAGASRADFLVGRTGRQSAGIADGGDLDARISRPFAKLPEFALGAPEAAKPEQRLLRALRIRPLQRAVID